MPPRNSIFYFAGKLAVMSSIITITFNPCIDVNSTIHSLAPDEKLRCSTPILYPGGGGINVSRAIKKLGGESTALYLAAGSNGRELTRMLDEEGIQSIVMEIKGNTRENLAVVDNSNGKQYRFIMPGPLVDDSALINLTKIISSQKDLRYIVVSGSLPPGMSIQVFDELAKIAERNAIRLIVDTSGQALKKAISSGVYMIKPSVRELLFLSGLKEDEINVEMVGLVKNLLRWSYCQVIVLSMGPAGALLATKDMVRMIRPPSVSPVSTVGAGDSLVAGIVWSLSQGRDLEEAVAYGCAAGTATTLKPGTSLCQLEDVETLFNKMKEDLTLVDDQKYSLL